MGDKNREGMISTIGKLKDENHLICTQGMRAMGVFLDFE